MPVFYMDIYNKDGSTFISRVPNDTPFTITSTGITAENYSTTVDFSNSNVIGYANTPNATTPDYAIGATSINIGTGTEDNVIYEVEVDKYTIETTKPKITVNCQDKTMEKNLVIKFSSESTLKKLLDGTKSAYDLFRDYGGKSVDELISYDDTENVINMSNMFYYCSSLESVPLLNTSNATNMTNMFYNCKALTELPTLNTSNVTNMNSMFNGCSNNLLTIPTLNTSNVTNMSYMFAYCSVLTTVPLLDTSNVTTMSFMFSTCSKLTTIPQLDTSNVTTMESMFYNCPSLTTIPLLNTSNVTKMGSMFGKCTSLTSVPFLDTRKVTSMSYMFQNCSSLTEIPAFAVSNVTSFTNTFYGCSSLSSILMIGAKVSFDISSSTQFTTEALHTIIDNLGTPSSTATLTMGSTNLAKVSEEYVTIATNKGWTLA